MPLLMRSFFDAAVDCLRPRVIALSLLPLAVALAVTAVVAYLFWGDAVAWASGWIVALADRMPAWADGWHVAGARGWLAPVLVVLATIPLVITLSLLLVSLLMSPAMVRIVAESHFGELRRDGTGSLVGSMAWALGNTLLALVVLVLSLPLWLLPLAVLVIPPLIWGWLTYRIMAHDALDLHASAQERRVVLREHRSRLVVMGIVCAYLSAAPAIVWMSLTVFALAFPLLIPVGIWIYTLVFVFSALWFTHYCLQALRAWRLAPAADTAARAVLQIGGASQ